MTHTIHLEHDDFLDADHWDAFIKQFDQQWRGADVHDVDIQVVDFQYTHT